MEFQELSERIAGTLAAYGVELPPQAMNDLIEMYCVRTVDEAMIRRARWFGGSYLNCGMSDNEVRNMLERALETSK